MLGTTGGRRSITTPGREIVVDMPSRSRADRVRDGPHPNRTRQLRRATDRLEAVLESLDLETEPRLAEEVATAIRATDRARELDAEGERTDRGAEGFVFPSALTDGGSARDRKSL